MTGRHAADRNTSDRRSTHLPRNAVAGVAVVCLGAAGVAAATLLPSSNAASASSAAAASGAGSGTPTPGASAKTTAPPTTTLPPLQVKAFTPTSGATAVAGTTSLTITTTAAVRLAPGDPTPSVSPSIHGSWSASGDVLTFSPSGAWPPDTTVTVHVPSGLRSGQGATLTSATSWSFRTGTGSVLRLQQLLASLNYLPLKWTATSTTATSTTATSTTATSTTATSTTATSTLDAAQRAVYSPPAGNFSWSWASPPPTLAAEWTPGTDTVMTRGAVMAFESDRHLTVDGVAGPEVWSQLLAASTASPPARALHGYTYALASKTLPQSLTVWHNGTVISRSGANAGIPAAPTADGTFPVYERLATQTMRGSNPNGSLYADPVAWVAYFNGGDAIHYIARSSYGSPQSLGCIEIPYAVGKSIWPHLTLGTLVTVTG